MKDNGGTPPTETIICGRCATACDLQDNFCRQCGMVLRDQDQQLPSVRNGMLPTTWRPPVPAVVLKGAAYIAAGTIAEILVRRAVRNAFGSARTAMLPDRRNGNGITPSNGSADEEQLLSETFLMRRVRIRR